MTESVCISYALKMVKRNETDQNTPASNDMETNVPTHTKGTDVLQFFYHTLFLNNVVLNGTKSNICRSIDRLINRPSECVRVCVRYRCMCFCMTSIQLFYYYSNAAIATTITHSYTITTMTTKSNNSNTRPTLDDNDEDDDDDDEKKRPRSLMDKNGIYF